MPMLQVLNEWDFKQGRRRYILALLDHGSVNQPNKKMAEGSHEKDFRAIMVFSASATVALDSAQYRIPPTYIGVRRVRPTSEAVRKALQQIALNSGKKRSLQDVNDSKQASKSKEESGQQSAKDPFNGISYKIVGEDGKERRMTAQEKKLHRYNLLQERKKLKQSGHLLTKDSVNVKRKSIDYIEHNGSIDAVTDETSSGTGDKDASWSNSGQDSLYFQLPVNQEALEEELALFDGNRVPPVIVPASMTDEALKAIEHFSTGVEISTTEPLSIIDDDLAQRWATAIKSKMEEAEASRAKEDLRPMAYTIVPEVWQRLRPGKIASGNVRSENEATGDVVSTNATSEIAESDHILDKQVNTKSNFQTEKRDPEENGDDDGDEEDNVLKVVNENNTIKSNWCYISIRSPSRELDQMHKIIFDQIYSGLGRKLYASCGSKFGCDWLIYDGPRQNRHAFAGIRILHANSTPFQASDEATNAELPVPCPFDIAGYVRGLNTAGKLALVATVVYPTPKCDTSMPRVAIVDLALEKILTAPTHQRAYKKKTGKRKAVGVNLDKKIS